MTPSRIFAVVLLLIGGLLAVVAVLALSPGESSYLRLLGGIAAAGAVATLLFAARLYFRKPAVHGDPPGLPWWLLQRLALLTIGLYAIGVPLYAVLVSGQIPTLTLDDSRMISLKAEPQSFWLMAGLYLVPGLYGLFMGLRRSG